MDIMKDDYISVTNMRTGEQETVSRSGLLNLANAIIVQACDDYVMPEFERERNYIERWIRSVDFDLYSRSCVSPELLITHLHTLIDNPVRRCRRYGKAETGL